MMQVDASTCVTSDEPSGSPIGSSEMTADGSVSLAPDPSIADFTPVRGDQFLQLTAELAGLKASVDEIRQLVVSRLADDEVKAKAFDRLYSDLDRARSDQEFERVRPLFLDLILLFDRIARAIDDCHAKSESNVDVEFLGSLRDELVEILRRREVDLIDAPAQVFDAAFQRIVGVVQSADHPSNTVAQVVRRGFIFRKRLVRPEEVVVNRPAANSAASRSSER
jgi:molecular chaperone GrpE